MEKTGQITGEQLETVKKVLRDFLTVNGHKVTAERLAMLEAIYLMDNHFDAVELHHQMRNRNYKVSMATIYNNIGLYEQAGLVVKHRFGHGKAKYERCYFRGDHDHIILTDIGTVMEFRDDSIDKIRETIETTFGVKVERHSLYFYARCCDEQKNLNRRVQCPFMESSEVS